MAHNQASLNERVEELIRQVTLLTDRVDRLEHQTQSYEKPIQRPTDPITKPAKQAERPKLNEERSLLVSGSSLLKHISAASFLLVIGLGLRTLADGGMFGQLAGTILGLGYAAALIACGSIFYHQKNTMAPLFTVIGALLMFSILLETHTRFSTLPIEAVYLMLAVTGIALAMVSRYYKVALPIIIGTLGMCLTAVAIDYPNPIFPYLGLMLWLSNILGFFASRIKRCSWLRWLLMLTTHFMLQIWGLKISGVLRGTATQQHINEGWFIPIVTLIGFTFVLISLFGIIRSGDEKISTFDFSLPAINAAWCYVAGIYALKSPELFGVPAAIAAGFHFALVFWLAQRKRVNAPGTNTFTAGGVILAGLSLPALMGGMLLPLPFLSLLALAICICSNIWSSGGMRITSYVLQGYILAIIAMEAVASLTAAPVPLMIIALISSYLAIHHYSYCRQNPPPPESIAFSRYDTHDRSATLPLLCGLTTALIAASAFGFFILSRNYSGELNVAFTGLVSLLINGAAILLMSVAAHRNNRELRNLSCFIMIMGGVKVFVYDMLQISGPWLVIGLLAFGIAAALQSLILARWKDRKEPDNATEPV
ncbi:hypothetical protein [Pelovirga terrestris]|uniref:DUF2339 domain-containing protein n=1 Tax=Pelovirga terrestris TaxID=2771352 RepID=A0A8J6QWQ0_9BACT|nr:hypothetical protein [Pelovirga terrestris]MBD1400038.1 hypothetical protein [Pelovirga terrestris]